MDDIDRAVAVLARGGLVAFPTETVYGLGADATNADAIARLYAVKGRPLGHPVIVHLGDAGQLDDVALEPSHAARALAAACWPGPLTLVVPRRAGAIVDGVTGGRATVGVRVPAHPLALDLLRRFARGVAAPSANRFGRVSPTAAEHVRNDLGDDVDLVLDGGPCEVGVESTIVACLDDRITVLRVGGVPVARIAEIVGRDVSIADRGEIAAPGTLEAHYSPRARVVVAEPDAVDDRVDALGPDLAIGVLALADVALHVTGVTRLDPPRDIDDYARVLYARLRDADRLALDVVVAVPPPDVGIGAAVRDRLTRAAR